MEKNSKEKGIDTLNEIKNFINESIDEYIGNIKNDIAIEDINNFNIGQSKYLFEHISDGLYDNKKGKKCIKEYVNTIKGDKNLRNFYNLFETIKNVNGVNNTKTFLNEALKISKKQDNKSVKKLNNIIKECASVMNLSNEKINNILEEYNNTIDYPLSYILSEEKTPSNLVLYTNNFGKVIDFLGNREKELNENVKYDSNNFNNLNSLLSEEDEKWKQDLYKNISLYTLSNKGNEKLFEDYKNDCINLIDENIEDTESISEKNNFQTMKEKLMEKKYNNETFVDDILKLSELKNTLNN